MKSRFDNIEKMFEETQVAHLLDAGFRRDNIKTEVMPISPPSECRYYSYNKTIAPAITK